MGHLTLTQFKQIVSEKHTDFSATIVIFGVGAPFSAIVAEESHNFSATMTGASTQSTCRSTYVRIQKKAAKASRQLKSRQ